MAVVNVNSTQLSNFYSTPPVRNNDYLSGGMDWTATDVCAMGASDSANSTYRFCQLPSNAVVLGVSVMNDANTSGTSYKCGLLLPSGGGVVVTGSDAILFPSGTSMATARNVFTNLYFPAIAGNSAAVANVTKRLWELLGLTTDPSAIYEVAVTAVTAGSAGGNLALQVNWTR